MGCATSSQLGPVPPPRQAIQRQIQVPDSGAPPIHIAVRELTSTLDVSISQGFLHGGGRISAATTSETSAIYKYVVDAQVSEGLRVLTSFPKMEVPKMPSFGAAVALAQGQAASMQMQSTSTVVVTAAPEGLPLSTKCVYVPFTADATLGYDSVKIQNVQDGVTGCIAHEANYGFRCVGMGIVSASTSVANGTSHRGVSSAALAELVFQKVHAPEVTATGSGQVEMTETFETMAFQNALTINVATAFGGMATQVPDLLPTLNAYGAQGWELDGFIMMQSSGTMPMASIMNGGMQPGMGMGQGSTQMPFQMFLSRVPARAATPVQYLILRHVCRLNMVQMMMGGGTPEILDNPKPVIEAYASRGWILKGTLNLPPEMRPGQVDIGLPVLLVFMSNTAAIPWAVPVAPDVEQVAMGMPFEEPLAEPVN